MMVIKYRGYWEYYSPNEEKLISDYFYAVDLEQLQLMLEEMQALGGQVMKINATRMVKYNEVKGSERND